MHYNTVLPETLDLLKKLMNCPLLSTYRLVGGTSLSLQIGHRISIDLDLFGKREYKDDELLEYLKTLGDGDVTHVSKESKINSFSINGIKVDLVDYHYPWLDEQIIEDGIRHATTKDIAAMKVSAIGSRSTTKVFVDLFFLLKQYTLYEIMSFFTQKYQIFNDLHYFSSLTYFDEADRDQMPTMLVDVSWEDVKKGIIKHVQKFKF
jgi:Nucleotidyl transferase AbiEii toxin, Type IV TA system